MLTRNVDRGVSPLMSNNPFRNKLTSPIYAQPSPQPTSTNPFLDASEINRVDENNQMARTANQSIEKTTNGFVCLK